MLTNRKNEIGECKFSKDDINAINFVTSVSNLRSYCYNIELKSKFDVAKIAGNIIPAVATTNAIVSSVQISELLKILMNYND